MAGEHAAADVDDLWNEQCRREHREHRVAANHKSIVRQDEHAPEWLRPPLLEYLRLRALSGDVESPEPVAVRVPLHRENWVLLVGFPIEKESNIEFIEQNLAFVCDEIDPRQPAVDSEMAVLHYISRCSILCQQQSESVDETFFDHRLLAHFQAREFDTE